jgi:hypothetical protein
MKMFTIILFIAFSCFQSSLFAQQGKDKPEEQEKKELSDLQKLAVSTGIIIKKEYQPVGKLDKDVTLQVLTITDLLAKVSTKGLRIEYLMRTSYSSGTYIAYIDKKECESMIKSLDIIRTEILPKTPNVYTETYYKTKEGVEIGCFLSDKGKWKAYLKVERIGEDYLNFLEMKDLGEFKTLIETAYQLMQ